jgi:hypothetical protein
MSTSSLPKIPPVPDGGPISNGLIVMERRLAVRYPLELSVRFRSISVKFPFFGVGRAINVSRGGILVLSQDEVSVGVQIEINLEWPTLLDEKIPLQLFASGRVLRRGTFHFATTIERYEFRTMRASKVNPDLLRIQSAGPRR